MSYYNLYCSVHVEEVMKLTYYNLYCSKDFEGCEALFLIFLEQIKRGSHFLDLFLGDVGVDPCSLEIFVTKELLDHEYVFSCVE